MPLPGGSDCSEPAAGCCLRRFEFAAAPASPAAWAQNTAGNSSSVWGLPRPQATGTQRTFSDFAFFILVNSIALSASKKSANSRLTCSRRPSSPTLIRLRLREAQRSLLLLLCDVQVANIDRIDHQLRLHAVPEVELRIVQRHDGVLVDLHLFGYL